MTFRNSKWSNYSVYNLKSHFKTSFFRIIFFITLSFLLILFSIFYQKYYILNDAANSLAFNLWSSVDAFDYYTSFIIWTATLFFSTLATSLHSYFFFNNFSNINNSDYDFETNRCAKDNVPLFTPNQSVSYLTYNWLVSNPSTSLQKEVLFNVFDSNINKNRWDETCMLFPKLYKTHHLLIRFTPLSRTVLNFIVNKNSFDLNNLLLFINNSTIYTNYVSLILWRAINNYSLYNPLSVKNKSKALTLGNDSYRLDQINTETTPYASLLHFKVGSFYLNDLTGGKLNNYVTNYPELRQFSDSLTSQLTAAKWNRWLYRYSILHRKILKNSHKITLFKRLLSDSPYSFYLRDNSLWTTNMLNKTQLTSSLFKSVLPYLNVDSQFLATSSVSQYAITPWNNNIVLLDLDKLNSHETSYFWFIKRFYFFNTIDANFIKSKKILSRQKKDFSENLKNKTTINFFSSNYLLKAPFFSYLKFDSILLNSIRFTPVSTITNFKTESIKDVFLSNEDSDLLSQPLLNVWYWTTLVSRSSNGFSFFNYLNVCGDLNTDNYLDNSNFKYRGSHSISKFNYKLSFGARHSTLLNLYMYDLLLWNTSLLKL